MNIQSFRSRPANWLRCVLGTLALLQMSIGPALMSVAVASNSSSFADNNTASPIKHVIVIIGENRSFDHVFATYVPKRPGVTVRNLLSEGIIALDANKNAIPGPNFEKAHQLAATDTGASDPFLLSPPEAEVSKQPAAGPAGRRTQGFLHSERVQLEHADQPVRGQPDARSAVRERAAAVVLSGSAHRRHGSDQGNARSAHHQRDRAACRPLSADQRLVVRLRRLRPEPGAPLLSDVAAAELQRHALHAGQPLRLRREALLLGRGDRRGRHGWRHAAGYVQPQQPDSGVLQHELPAGRHHDR